MFACFAWSGKLCCTDKRWPGRADFLFMLISYLCPSIINLLSWAEHYSWTCTNITNINTNICIFVCVRSTWHCQVKLADSRILIWGTSIECVSSRVAKTCQSCQSVGANFSRPVLIFLQITRKTVPLCPLLISFISYYIIHSGLPAL